ncbi:MAG: hypothetical protein FWE09_00030 [Treponema sp.]|nr:hypothetical protein [Treponema sp.]
MKRMSLALILSLAFALAACSGHSRDDYYGAWLLEAEGMALVAEISADALSFDFFSDDFNWSDTYEVWAWGELQNEDPVTRDDFPRGFALATRKGLETDEARFFLSRDGQRLLSVEGTLRQVYDRLAPASSITREDFYGDWFIEADGTHFRMAITRDEYKYSREDFRTGEFVDMFSLYIAQLERKYNIDPNTRGDYPYGFTATGTYSQGAYSQDGSSSAGSLGTVTIYMHRDKNSLWGHGENREDTSAIYARR